MRSGHSSGQRQQPEDRYSDLNLLQYTHPGLGPHALTLRATYTVPTGKKSRIQMTVAQVQRVTVAGPSGRAGPWLFAHGSAFYLCTIFTNNVGDFRDVVVGPSFTASQGQVCQIYTEDLSTGGTCLHVGTFAYNEYWA